MSTATTSTQCARDLTKEIIYQDEEKREHSPLANGHKLELKLVHFNDVYNVDPNNIEPKAGAARFLTAVDYVKNEQPCMVLFSGDCFSPSSRKTLNQSLIKMFLNTFSPLQT